MTRFGELVVEFVVVGGLTRLRTARLEVPKTLTLSSSAVSKLESIATRIATTSTIECGEAIAELESIRKRQT